MAIDVFQLYLELCGKVNTHQGGHIRPNGNFIQWVNSISLSLYEEKFGDWEKSQKNTDDLSKPFLKSANIKLEKAGAGNYNVFGFPDDYGHFSSARYFLRGSKVVPKGDLDLYDSCGKKVELSGDKPPEIDEETWEVMQSEKNAGKVDEVEMELTEVPITKVVNNKWAAALEHRFKKPKLDAPIMNQYDGGFRVAPIGVTMIVLDYLRMPEPATFNYTVVPGDPETGKGDHLVYDAAKSKPLDWSMLVKNEIVNRLKKDYGGYVRENFIWQTSKNDIAQES